MPTIFLKKVENTATIGANSIWQPTDTQLSEDLDIAKYAPFNRITAYNRSDKDVEVRLFGTNITDKGVMFLPAGAAKEMSIKYMRPAIYNRDSSNSIAVNKIILEIEKVVV